MTHAPALFILTEQLTAWGHKLAADTSSHRAATLLCRSATTPRFDKGKYFSLWAERDTGGTRHPLLFRRCPSLAPPSPPATVPGHVHAKKSRYFLGERRRLFGTAAPRPAQPLAAKMAAPPAAPSPGAAPARGDRPAPRRPPPSSSAAAAAGLGSPCRGEASREGGRQRARLRDPAWLREGRCLGSSLPLRHGPGRGPEQGCWVPRLRGEALGEQIVVTGIKKWQKATLCI